MISSLSGGGLEFRTSARFLASISFENAVLLPLYIHVFVLNEIALHVRGFQWSTRSVMHRASTERMTARSELFAIVAGSVFYARCNAAMRPLAAFKTVFDMVLVCALMFAPLVRVSCEC